MLPPVWLIDWNLDIKRPRVLFNRGNCRYMASTSFLILIPHLWGHPLRVLDCLCTTSFTPLHFSISYVIGCSQVVVVLHHVFHTPILRHRVLLSSSIPIPCNPFIPQLLLNVHYPFYSIWVSTLSCTSNIFVNMCISATCSFFFGISL